MKNMNNYIVRGYSTWTFADNREDALVRFLSRLDSGRPLDLSTIVVCQTSDDWSVSDMDGCLNATHLVKLDPPTLLEITEALSTLVSRAETLANFSGKKKMAEELDYMHRACFEG
tara:strand:+ start:431 stop:775 length:345 start_codon:yes stop_codon:yes gene_type:complete